VSGLIFGIRYLDKRGATSVIVVLFYVFDDFHIAVAHEGGRGCGDDMKQCSQRPDIASFIIFFLQDFRRDIVRGSQDLIGAVDDKLLLHIILPLVGESKIDEYDVIVISAAKQKIFRLEVPMADLLEV